MRIHIIQHVPFEKPVLVVMEYEFLRMEKEDNSIN